MKDTFLFIFIFIMNMICFSIKAKCSSPIRSALRKSLLPIAYLGTIQKPMLASVSKFATETKSKHANFHKVTTFKQVTPFVTDKTLVVLDIDNTLFVPKDFMGFGSMAWGLELMNKLKAHGLTNKEATEYTSYMWYNLQHRIQMSLTETLLPTWLADLHSRDIKTLAVTARPTWTESATRKILEDLELPIWNNTIADAMVDFSKLAEDHALYNTNMVYSHGLLLVDDNNHKGQGLVGLLAHLKIKMPEHVVFIDDAERHVRGTLEELEKLGIRVDGFHYENPSEQSEAIRQVFHLSQKVELK